jgi:hypothetical protein
MYDGGPSSWGRGNSVGTIYFIEEERLGHNERNPKAGLALCVEHSGDYFYDYIPVLLDKRPGWVKGALRRKFGSYTFSKRFKKLTGKQFHLLMAGEKVRL